MPKGLAALIVGKGGSPKGEPPTPSRDQYDELAEELVSSLEAKDSASLATVLRAVAGGSVSRSGETPETD